MRHSKFTGRRLSNCFWSCRPSTYGGYRIPKCVQLDPIALTSSSFLLRAGFLTFVSIRLPLSHNYLMSIMCVLWFEGVLTQIFGAVVMEVDFRHVVSETVIFVVIFFWNSTVSCTVHRFTLLGVMFVFEFKVRYKEDLFIFLQRYKGRPCFLTMGHKLSLCVKLMVFIRNLGIYLNQRNDSAVEL